jgi:maltooligosyltrehalose trehalohydrolase
MLDWPKNVRESGHVVRRLPMGAEVRPDGGTHFRVWAPRCRHVAVRVQGTADSEITVELSGESGGYFSGFSEQANAGDRYGFLLDDDEKALPDPVSRFQPDGPHGLSEIIDPRNFEWNDADWPGVKLAGQIIYELHLGTFTREGTWQAAERELAELADAGITLIEVMPVSTFPGRFNWGYDGVDLFAPCAIYGRPNDMRHFVDAAHRLGIGVILDVVYNHIGPDGNYLKRFADEYFTDKHTTDWGEAINYYDRNCSPVREFFIHNAGYWIDEFHLDGLRLDATQNIYDESADHVIAALTRHARSRAEGRWIVVVAENEPQEAKLVRSPEKGGYGADGLWNDDFHHSALVAITGHNEAYYSDYLGRAEELMAACKWGYLYQGQWSQWQEKPRGTASRDLPPWAFITFLENHDQVSNSLRGLRVHQLAQPGRFRAMTALLFLSPGTPMLFQGQEFGASTPFLFFADHNPDLAPLVYKGRKEFLAQFPSVVTEESQAAIDDPASEETFNKCRLNFSERQKHAAIYRLHKDLIRLRKTDPALAPRDQRWFDGTVLGDEAFLLRYFADDEHEDRLLLVNLGADRIFCPLPEPLLAPPTGCEWAVRWSSEDSAYGGLGTPPLIMHDDWKMLGESALWLAPERCDE